MDAISATPAAKAAEELARAKPAAKPPEPAPAEPKRDRVEVSDEAKAKLAAEEQQRTSSQNQQVERTDEEQKARTQTALQVLAGG